MKDFLNFKIQTKGEGANVRYTIRHRKRDNMVVEFTTPVKGISAEHIPTMIEKVMRLWTNKYMKVTRKVMSPKQRAYYDAVVWFWQQEGRAPSYEEQCELMGLKSKGTAWSYANRLLEMGWLWKDEDGRIVPVDIAAPEFTE